MEKINVNIPPIGSNADWDELMTGVPVEFWTDEMRQAPTHEEARQAAAEDAKLQADLAYIRAPYEDGYSAWPQA